MDGQGIKLDELTALLTGSGSPAVADRVDQVLKENPDALIFDLLDPREMDDSPVVTKPVRLGVSEPESLRA